MDSGHVVGCSSRFFVDAENTGVDDDAARRRRRHLLSLDACFLCKRYIGSDRHIFMYKGDMAFCSDGCRQEQVDMDAALARSSARPPRRHRGSPQQTSPPAPPSCPAN